MIRDRDILLISILAFIILSAYFQIDWTKELKDTIFKNDIGSYDSYMVGKNTSDMKYIDGRLTTPTVLNKEQMKVQQETGCFQNCHKDFK